MEDEIRAQMEANASAMMNWDEKVSFFIYSISIIAYPMTHMFDGESAWCN